MRDKNIEDIYDAYDYGPNELAQLSIDNYKEYRKIVQSNLEPSDTVEKWEQRNLDHAQKLINSQRK